MLYGVETQPGGGSVVSGGGAYTASAVTFNSAKLVRSSLSCTDNQYFGFAGWLQTDWTNGGQVAWVVDPTNNYLSAFDQAVAPNRPSFSVLAVTGGFPTLEIDSTSVPDTGWHHFICAAQTNLAAGSKIIKMRIDGAASAGTKTDVSASFNVQSNGMPFWVGSDNSGFWLGNMCDVSVWAGINLLTSGDIADATVQLFRSAGGAPVNPTVAIAALGTPPVFLTGNAASFASNSHGSSGAFTITAGTLTNASTHP